MTAREAETRRRRRVRREGLERAYREWVCGGPLVDVAAPIIGGPGDAEHRALVTAELELRSINAQREIKLLVQHFTATCLVRRAEKVRMYALLSKLLKDTGPPNSWPTHSTTPGVRTLTGSTIPRLQGGT